MIWLILNIALKHQVSYDMSIRKINLDTGSNTNIWMKLITCPTGGNCALSSRGYSQMDINGLVYIFLLFNTHLFFKLNPSNGSLQGSMYISDSREQNVDI
jgi:hypothetical protein